jgi:hypothetical protein
MNPSLCASLQCSSSSYFLDLNTLLHTKSRANERILPFNGVIKFDEGSLDLNKFRNMAFMVAFENSGGQTRLRKALGIIKFNVQEVNSTGLSTTREIPSCLDTR